MLSLLLAVAFAFTQQDAQLAHRIACDFVASCTPRDAGTIRGKIAADFILDRASMTGADVRRDPFRAQTPRGEMAFTNLSCEFRNNPTSDWVVLVSHFDTKRGTGCPGANDGAATAALLVSLAEALVNRPLAAGNVLLVWTDGEECLEAYGERDGLWGSKRAAERLAERKLPVRAVLCLDMLGDRDLHISIPANGTPSLAAAVRQSARRIGRPDLVSPLEASVKDDHVPFLDRGFPAVDLIDFQYGPGNSYWHTPQDTVDKISEDSLLAAGRLVAELLNTLL